MTLWLALGLMTAAAIFVALRPILRRAPDPGAGAAGSDLAVYRDQLAEIDRDLAQGAVSPDDAQAARVEVSRRLIAAADQAKRAAEQTGPQALPATRRRRFAVAAALIALPLGALAFYTQTGSPDLPGQPLAERLARGDGAKGPSDDILTLASLVMRVEAHLESNPDDGRGWELLAPVYMRFERFDDAAKARRNAIRILGATGDRVAALGEALTSAGGGVVTPEAKAEFERAVAIDPGQLTATLYLGLAAKQAGQREEARRIWEGMLARAPAGADWVDFVKQAIAALGEEPGGGAPSAAAGGNAAAGAPPATSDAPRTEEAPGAPAAPSRAPEPAGPVRPAEMSASDREAARSMVDRLAARLAENGGDVDGWLMLVRSYLVLGERDKASAAAGDARRALAGDADKLQRLEGGMKSLGVEG